MYRFHPDVVARVQALSAPSQAAQHGAIRAKVRLLTGQLKAEKDLGILSPHEPEENDAAGLASFVWKCGHGFTPAQERESTSGAS